jgi:hypothetical protein
MNPKATVEEFYKLSSKKILLSFTVLKTINKKLQFMSRHTMPQMPVWAAIVASSS